MNANSGEGENQYWSPMDDPSSEANDVEEKLKVATPSSATSEALLAQVSAEFSEDTLGSSEVSEVEENRDLGGSGPDGTESTVIFSDEEITAFIEDLEQEQQFDSEQDNPSLADQMTDEQLDEHIIQTEHDRIVEFYNGKNMEEEGLKRAKDYKNQALNKARSF